MCTGRREVATLKKLTAADKDGRFIARLLETFLKDGRHVIVMEFVEVHPQLTCAPLPMLNKNFSTPESWTLNRTGEVTP